MTAVASGVVDPNVWHYMQFVSEGTTNLTLYVDGAQGGTASVVASPTPFSASATIGGSAAAPWTGHFAGVIGRVALYPQALSAEHIQAHYQAALRNGCGSLQAIVDVVARGGPFSAGGCLGQTM